MIRDRIAYKLQLLDLRPDQRSQPTQEQLRTGLPQSRRFDERSAWGSI